MTPKPKTPTASGISRLLAAGHTCQCGEEIAPCSCPAAVCLGWVHPGALHGCIAKGPFDGRIAFPHAEKSASLLAAKDGDHR
jgi:hypothetical protein